jgi:hypothetical protein
MRLIFYSLLAASLCIGVSFDMQAMEEDNNQVVAEASGSTQVAVSISCEKSWLIIVWVIHTYYIIGSLQAAYIE